MLIDFYGRECPHCLKMMPLVDRLEKEAAVKVQKLEVWHDAKNAEEMEHYDNGACGGVPFFVNTDTGDTICGEAPYEVLKKWAGAK